MLGVMWSAPFHIAPRLDFPRRMLLDEVVL